MRYPLSIISLFALASVHAAVVQFNVVSPNSNNVQVNINGESIPLTRMNDKVPVYSGYVECGQSMEYNYGSDGINEPFIRALSPDTASTYYEYFARPVTYNNLPRLPTVLNNGMEWKRATLNPDIYDDNYIPTIFIDGDSVKMNDIVDNVPKKHIKVDVTFVARDYVQTFSNASFGISGALKPDNNAKQSWKWRLAPGDFLNERNHFKLRHMEEDPTQMREKLYADCLRAMGTYANQANMVRLFINGEGFGTFNMLDDVQDYSYIRANFYNGQPPVQMGPLYDGASGAGFQYSENQDIYWSFKPNSKSPEGPEIIQTLAKAFHDTDVTNDMSIAKFNEMFDIDQFLRFMVMEYLAGHWDGYWQEQTNDGAYLDYANNNMWYYLGQDYDATFGINIAIDTLNLSYKKYPDMFPGGVLINGFLQNTELQKRFEGYIIETVKTLFNNNTLGEHILAYNQFIAPDLEWDRSIKQRSPGANYEWTYSETYENIFNSIPANPINGGGAEYGLIDWIAKKSIFVANDLQFSL
ncbi:coth protein-domain-containing protein [Pilobolus umbonatus]|nr:coth protein-domain-containing protein [Pilobolus umbonatus]